MFNPSSSTNQRRPSSYGPLRATTLPWSFGSPSLLYSTDRPHPDPSLRLPPRPPVNPFQYDTDFSPIIAKALHALKVSEEWGKGRPQREVSWELERIWDRDGRGRWEKEVVRRPGVSEEDIEVAKSVIRNLSDKPDEPGVLKECVPQQEEDYDPPPQTNEADEESAPAEEAEDDYITAEDALHLSHLGPAPQPDPHPPAEAAVDHLLAHLTEDEYVQQLADEGYELDPELLAKRLRWRRAELAGVPFVEDENVGEGEVAVAAGGEAEIYEDGDTDDAEAAGYEGRTHDVDAAYNDFTHHEPAYASSPPVTNTSSPRSPHPSLPSSTSALPDHLLAHLTEDEYVQHLADEGYELDPEPLARRLRWRRAELAGVPFVEEEEYAGDGGEGDEVVTEGEAEAYDDDHAPDGEAAGYEEGPMQNVDAAYNDFIHDEPAYAYDAPAQHTSIPQTHTSSLRSTIPDETSSPFSPVHSAAPPPTSTSSASHPVQLGGSPSNPVELRDSDEEEEEHVTDDGYLSKGLEEESEERGQYAAEAGNAYAAEGAYGPENDIAENPYTSSEDYPLDSDVAQNTYAGAQDYGLRNNDIGQNEAPYSFPPDFSQSGWEGWPADPVSQVQGGYDAGSLDGPGNNVYTAESEYGAGPIYGGYEESYERGGYAIDPALECANRSTYMVDDLDPSLEAAVAYTGSLIQSGEHVEPASQDGEYYYSVPNVTYNPEIHTAAPSQPPPEPIYSDNIPPDPYHPSSSHDPIPTDAYHPPEQGSPDTLALSAALDSMMASMSGDASEAVYDALGDGVGEEMPVVDALEQDGQSQDALGLQDVEMPSMEEVGPSEDDVTKTYTADDVPAPLTADVPIEPEPPSKAVHEIIEPSEPHVAQSATIADERVNPVDQDVAHVYGAEAQDAAVPVSIVDQAAEEPLPNAEEITEPTDMHILESIPIADEPPRPSEAISIPAVFDGFAQPDPDVVDFGTVVPPFHSRSPEQSLEREDAELPVMEWDMDGLMEDGKLELVRDPDANLVVSTLVSNTAVMPLTSTVVDNLPHEHDCVLTFLGSDEMDGAPAGEYDAIDARHPHRNSSPDAASDFEEEHVLTVDGEGTAEPSAGFYESADAAGVYVNTYDDAAPSVEENDLHGVLDVGGQAYSEGSQGENAPAVDTAEVAPLQINDGNVQVAEAREDDVGDLHSGFYESADTAGVYVNTYDDAAPSADNVSEAFAGAFELSDAADLPPSALPKAGAVPAEAETYESDNGNGAEIGLVEDDTSDVPLGFYESADVTGVYLNSYADAAPSVNDDDVEGLLDVPEESPPSADTYAEDSSSPDIVEVPVSTEVEPIEELGENNDAADVVEPSTEFHESVDAADMYGTTYVDAALELDEVEALGVLAADAEDPTGSSVEDLSSAELVEAGAEPVVDPFQGHDVTSPGDNASDPPSDVYGAADASFVTAYADAAHDVEEDDLLDILDGLEEAFSADALDDVNTDVPDISVLHAREDEMHETEHVDFGDPVVEDFEFVSQRYEYLSDEEEEQEVVAAMVSNGRDITNDWDFEWETEDGGQGADETETDAESPKSATETAADDLLTAASEGLSGLGSDEFSALDFRETEAEDVTEHEAVEEAAAEMDEEGIVADDVEFQGEEEVLASVDDVDEPPDWDESLEWSADLAVDSLADANIPSGSENESDAGSDEPNLSDPISAGEESSEEASMLESGLVEISEQEVGDGVPLRLDNELSEDGSPLSSAPSLQPSDTPSPFTLHSNAPPPHSSSPSLLQDLSDGHPSSESISERQLTSEPEPSSPSTVAREQSVDSVSEGDSASASDYQPSEHDDRALSQSSSGHSNPPLSPMRARSPSPVRPDPPPLARMDTVLHHHGSRSNLGVVEVPEIAAAATTPAMNMFKKEGSPSPPMGNGRILRSHCVWHKIQVEVEREKGLFVIPHCRLDPSVDSITDLGPAKKDEYMRATEDLTDVPPALERVLQDCFEKLGEVHTRGGLVRVLRPVVDEPADPPAQQGGAADESLSAAPVDSVDFTPNRNLKRSLGEGHYGEPSSESAQGRQPKKARISEKLKSNKPSPLQNRRRSGSAMAEAGPSSVGRPTRSSMLAHEIPDHSSPPPEGHQTRSHGKRQLDSDEEVEEGIVEQPPRKKRG